MADDDYGAAQPIADVGRGIYKKANDIYSRLTGGGDIAKDAVTPVGKKSYQADPADVKKANDSFLPKPDPQKIPTQTKAQKRPAVSTKIQVKTSVKPGPQKQAGGK